MRTKQKIVWDAKCPDSAQRTDTPFISIVIPVYNVRDYLRQCLESVRSCEFSDLEVILVNDGSTDNSGLLCDQFVQSNPAFSVIHQQNQGLSAARNAGLRAARGRYIAFFDSDDMILSEAFTKTVSRLIEATALRTVDILASDYYFLKSDGTRVLHPQSIRDSEKIKFGVRETKYFLSPFGVFWNTWRFIFRREFLIENELYFSIGHNCEDLEHTVRSMIVSKATGFYHCPYYCYRIGRDNSIMSVTSLKRIRDFSVMLNSARDALLQVPDLPWQSVMLDKLVLEYILNLPTCLEVAKKDRKEAFEALEASRYILRNATAGLSRPAAVIIGVLRVSFSARLLRGLKHCKRKLKIP